MEPAGEARKPGGKLSPTLLAQASRCLHFFYLEKFGDHSKKLQPTAGQTLERQRGIEFEEGVVASLKDVQRPEWDGKNFAAGFRATLKLMEDGAPWIHGGPIVGSMLGGIPDLLQRRPGRSRFGRHMYTPVEIKSHKDVQPRDVIQVAAYGTILEEVQGAACRKGGVWLNTGKVAEVDLEEAALVFEKLLREVARVQARKVQTEAVWCGACQTCPWIEHCWETWERTDHLSLLPNGGKSTVQKLYAAGVTTFRALAKAEPATLAAKAKMGEKTVQRLWNHARARVQGHPLIVSKPKFPEGIPILFYDIETYEGATFLHGVVRVEGDKREEKFFFADSLDEAPETWHQFLNYVARDKDSVVYCWADYERGRSIESWEKFGGDERAYHALMDRLVDQCKWTQVYFAFPTRSYSIKEIAPVFGFQWQAEDAGGMNCEAWYGQWLGSRDPRLKEKILTYNRDDCVAMEIIFKRLQALCRHEGA